MIKRFYALILICLCLFSCLEKRSKETHIATEQICGKLYAEKYSAHKGGVYGGDLVGVYLTDSLNFRKFLGTIDDKEYYSFNCLGTELKIDKISRRMGDKGKKGTQTFNIAELIDSKVQD